MIQIENISFNYAGSTEKVFNYFSLQLKENNIYGLLGKNGTGKSTLLYLISGLLHAKKGTITYDGIETRKRRPEVLEEMFIVPEEFELPDTTLDEYVRINSPFYPRFSREVLDSCLNDFELPTTLKLNSLSMGQKKKVFMSFALAAGHPLEGAVPPCGGRPHDRRPHAHHLYPSGARCGAAARPHSDSRQQPPAARCLCGRPVREI